MFISELKNAANSKLSPDEMDKSEGKFPNKVFVWVQIL